MLLQLNHAIATRYKSRSPIARVVTEDWALRQLYCAACDSNSLRPFPANTKAVDYQCPKCSSGFQLKSGSGWSTRRIPDAAYASMMLAVQSDRVPNLLVMQYTKDWSVRNLMLVPSFFLVPSAIERRRPLSPSARRAGWVGCNILLGAIAPEGKLAMVRDGVAVPAPLVREHYNRVRPLGRLSVKLRGWTLDVLRIVHQLNRNAFNLSDVYAFEPRLHELHPQNLNIRPKIRQQLQVLRDFGLLRFVGKGCYELAPDLRRETM
jgi:type II restriction enzyme